MSRAGLGLHLGLGVGAGVLVLVRVLVLVLVGVLGLGGGVAHAHGGLPVSQRILRAAQGEPMYIPVVYWGVWVGSEAGPWTWICEEAINTNQFRRVEASRDGTLYATDTRGLTISTDGGCTWSPLFGGELPALRVAEIVADPVDGATAYAVTSMGYVISDGGMVAASNGLFVTHDHGASFTRMSGLAAAGRLLHAVRIAPSTPPTLYVSSTQLAAPPAPVLHRSVDGGSVFTELPLAYTLEGVVPTLVEVIGVHPKDPQVVYLRVSVSLGAGGTRQALLRSGDGGASFAELWKLDAVSSAGGQIRGIEGIAFDGDAGAVYVATMSGILRGEDPGGSVAVVLAPRGNLAQAQCVDVRGGVVYACANNYAPDFAALARSSDQGQTFEPLFRYADTQGPMACPPGTPAAEQCPIIWQSYSEQLGVERPDAGGIDAGTPPPAKGCDCDLAGAPGGPGRAAAILAITVLLLGLLRRRLRG